MPLLLRLWWLCGTVSGMRCRFRWLWVSLPALLVTSPLLGSYHAADHKNWVYGVSAESGMSFWLTVRRVFGQLGLYLVQDQNFRPVGRLLLDLEAWFSWEVAVVTGVPVHVVHGVWRVVLLVGVAVVLDRFVGLFLSEGSVGFWVLPMVLAGFVVVGSNNHSFLYYPVLMMVVVGWMLWVPVRMLRGGLVCRGVGVWADRVGLLGWVLLGCVAGLVYELLWVAPVFFFGVLLAVWWMRGLGFGGFVGSVGFGRWVCYSVGTVLVVVGVKVASKVVCVVSGFCGYEFNRVDVGELVFSAGTVSGRLLTGLPPVSWRVSAGVPLGPVEVVGNGFLLLVVGLLVWLAVLGVRGAGGGVSGGGVGWWLAGVGLVLMLVVAVPVSAHWSLYECGFGCVGTVFKESLLVQLGWVLVVVGLVDVLVGWVRGRWGERWGERVLVWVFVLVTVCALVTLVRVEAFARLERTFPGWFPYVAASGAMVSVVDDPVHEVWRCAMVEDLVLDPEAANTVYDMQRLSERVWGVPFCSGLVFEDNGRGVLDVVGTRYEGAYLSVPDVGLVGPGCDSPVERFACPGGELLGVYVRHALGRLVSHGFLDRGVADRVGVRVVSGVSGVTRLQLGEVLLGLSGRGPVGSPVGVFVDVGDVGAAGVVEAVWEAGLVEPCGVDPLRFCPYRVARRDAFIWGLVRVLGE